MFGSSNFSLLFTNFLLGVSMDSVVLLSCRGWVLKQRENSKRLTLEDEFLKNAFSLRKRPHVSSSNEASRTTSSANSRGAILRSPNWTLHETLRQISDKSVQHLPPVDSR